MNGEHSEHAPVLRSIHTMETITQHRQTTISKP